MRRQVAQLFSYLFHPAIYPILGTFVLLRSLPMQYPSKMILLTVVMVFCGTYLIPVIASVLLFRYGLVRSLQMEEARDRRLPYIFSAVSFYFTSLLLRQVEVLHEAYLFLLASATVIIIHLLLLPYTKPSAHLGGIGGFLGLMLALSFRYGLNFWPYIAGLVLLSGIIASARLRLKAHSVAELWLGFLSGFLVVFGIVWGL